MPSNELPQLALPTLYGAPAYGRPRVSPAAPIPRPFDPDDLPLAAAMTDEERAQVAQLPAGAWHPGGIAVAAAPDEGAADAPAGRRGRSFAWRLFGRS